MARPKWLAVTLLVCFAIAQALAADTSAVTPRTEIVFTPTATTVDGNVNTGGNTLEWNTLDGAAMQCTINAGDPKSSPTCPAPSAGPNNAFFIAPMAQAGDLGGQPILGMLYVHKECNGKCTNAATQCRLCFVALANLASNGQKLVVDPDPTQNWVKVYPNSNAGGNLVDGSGVLDVPPTFAPVYLGTQLQGYEACSAYGETYVSSGALVVPVGASTVVLDAHLHITYPAGTTGFQTARLVSANTNGLHFNLLACSDDNPAPTCQTPPTLTTGTVQDLTTNQCTSSTSYRVTLNAANTVGPIPPPAGCTLETDGRTSGDGPVSFICGPLDRGTTYTFAFTAQPEDTLCSPVTTPVTITPPALEALTLTATPPTDEACDATSGHLTFSVAASPALSAAQYNGAVLVVTSKATSATVQGCTVTRSANGFVVDCTGLADGVYDLAVTVPNTQYPGCPYTTIVTGTVTLIPAASLAPAGDPQDLTAKQCTDSTSYRVTLNAVYTGTITPATGCTLETDGRDATGSGAVSFICGPLKRGTTHDLVFTAASTSTECPPVTATVSITPPTLEAITLTATPPADAACDATSGHLIFSVAASPAMSATQYNGAKLIVKKIVGTTYTVVTTCTATRSANGFVVDCTGLADGTYKLYVSVPNVQYSGCPYYMSVIGTVSLIPAASLAAAGDAQDLTTNQCTDSTSYRVTLNAVYTGTITPATGCTLETDGRDATGSGAVSFICGPLKRGTTHDLVFTAASTSTECPPVTATVSITPPTLEAITLTATPPADAACDATSGHLIFSVAASPAMSATQYNGAKLIVKKIVGTTYTVVTTCTATRGADGFVVDCTGLADGAYKLYVSVPNVQYSGCPYRAYVAGTVSIIPPPPFAVTTPPAAQTICPADTTSFEFTVTGAGDGLVYTYDPAGGAKCGQPNAAGVVTCTGVAASVSVSAVAHYGKAQGEDCSTAPLLVPLTLAFDAPITAASVTATSPPTVCPGVPSAEAKFTVTTSSDTKSLTAVLLEAVTLKVVPGVTCTTTGAGTAWAVSCPGAPVPGKYVVSLAATSALDCLYDLGVDNTAVVTLSRYNYVLDAGPDLSAVACVGYLGQATITLAKYTGLSGATFTATPNAPAPAACVKSGATFKCTGLPLGDTKVLRKWVSRFDLWPYVERFALDVERELRAELGGKPDLIIGNYSDGNLVASLLAHRMFVTQCNIAHALEKTKYQDADIKWWGGCCTLEDDVIITVTSAPCCYTRTHGYWSTHGEEMKPWLAATPIQLWDRSFSAAGLTADNTFKACTTAPRDALRVLCVNGQKMCSAAQLGRQCMAALVNARITAKCGDTNNCFTSTNSGAAKITQARLTECCGPSGPAPSGTILSTCITDVTAFNQDKASLGTTCAASELPQGGPGLTQKVCNDYISAFGNAGTTQTCEQGYCYVSSLFTSSGGRRLYTF
ncbi:sucrose synthase [Raphidocelis subcapitata]|uniref:sucrose synthase n=1 Tax=Raphidocelis subcapitata TaxID=307507 RepID=A0A2V0NUJ3_9CHLO|nr:sucrose synthase [Raphidocelis subcapitata]|eukprot:GBF89213.1 sucrose synthase [Raphidocelis subcapitata]